MANPRRALFGSSLGPEDFPGLDLADVRWLTTENGQRAIELVETRPLTAEEQAIAAAIAEAVDDTERTLRERARTALDTNRNFRDSTAAQLLSGAQAIIDDPTVTQAEAVTYIKQLAQAVRALTNQVESLTRQMIGMARIVLEDRDGVD